MAKQKVVRRRRAPRVPRPIPVRNNSILEFINPFSDHKGKKWPDESAIPTVSFRLRQFGVFPSGAGDTVRSILIASRINDMLYVNPTYTGTDTYPITDWGTAADPSSYNELNTNFDSYRICSWGVKIYSVGKPLDASGYLTILTNAQQPTTTVGNSPTTFALKKDVFPVQNQMEVRWVGVPVDNKAREFYATTTSQTNWTYPTIFVNGTTADTVLRYEIVMDLELIPESGTFTERVATPAASYNTGLLQKIENAYASIRGAYGNIDGGSSYIHSFAEQAARGAGQMLGQGFAAAGAMAMANRLRVGDPVGAQRIAYY
jgi:hypothetical protein